MAVITHWQDSDTHLPSFEAINLSLHKEIKVGLKRTCVLKSYESIKILENPPLPPPHGILWGLLCYQPSIVGTVVLWDGFADWTILSFPFFVCQLFLDLNHFRRQLFPYVYVYVNINNHCICVYLRVHK